MENFYLTLLTAERVDRIAVLVTGDGEDMLVGVQKTGRGTGKH